MGGTSVKKRISICLAALLLLSLCACTGGMSGTGRNDATGTDGNYVAPNGETGGTNTDGNANGTDGNTDGERDDRFDDNRDLGDDIDDGLDKAREGLDDFVDDVTGRDDENRAGERNDHGTGRADGRENGGAPATGGGTPGTGR